MINDLWYKNAIIYCLHVGSFMDTSGDGIADVVYAGDLAGNMWKFDLTSSTPSEWGVAFGGSPLYSTGGQPITTRPDVTKLSQGGYLVVGSTERVANAAELGLETAYPFVYRKR